MKSEDINLNTRKDAEFSEVLFGALNHWHPRSSSGSSSERRWKKIQEVMRPSCSISESGWFCMTGKIQPGTSDLIADLREEMSEGM